ncbi:thiol reductant ABC exporter subunit CydD [Youhaiella tibetensis]|uniref:Thiol reductant ABC exporter subunit CydD n=1 Tax=Paradevosia tibetensis TaxID=1447062 RepID=A0A5B9DM15_9HYPH|nr:thiol reductant ABC exporter subunit CydD [Youhaiella tibetensis]QEE20320.1 thiol reductant ABC exporter subunit CydD [Youhaiella tibetensis]GGF25183.1 thiol reductant ABC exporter subunit CydD [Youhaiella tibetensis]
MVESTERAASRWLGKCVADGGAGLRVAIALPLLSGALLVAQCYVLAGVLHGAIIDHRPLALLGMDIAIFGALLTARIALAMAGEMLAVNSGEAIKLKIRGGLAAQMLMREPIWFAGRSSGALSGTVVDQVDALEGYFVRYLPAAVQAAMLPLAFAVVVMPVDWIVGLLLLVTAPLIPVFMALAGWGAEAASKAQAQALNRLGGRFADRLRGLVTLKLFGREDAEVAGARAASEELRVRTMRVMRIAFLSSAVLEFFAALGVAGVALYIGLTFLDLVTLRGTELTLQAGLFCLLLAPEVYQPLRLMAAHYHDRAAAKAAAAEIANQAEGFPDATPLVALYHNPPLRHEGAAKLAIEGLTVKTPQGRTVIEGLALDVAPGTRIAILGESGIGKSTLLEAIGRLRAATGEIAIDGAPLNDIGEGRLRQRMAMLNQRPRIFAGSLADNIRLGRRGACDTAVTLAAQRARVTDFARLLPEGLETRLGEDGLGLSGGEIQRVALARLYLRDPGLMLLDEPTAHLDPETEALVLDGLLDFAQGRTLVVATHSRFVAARMDKVFRLAGGKLLPTIRPARVRTDGRGAA